ncbi:MAG: patatin-like phospholipase family protein [Rhodoplanes sp.]
MPKRAIALAGGGPAAALHIGALEYLREQGIAFDKRDDVWALSCIGAWVGIVYNQCDKGAEVEQTKRFFRDNVYRDDISYSRFRSTPSSGRTSSPSPGPAPSSSPI